MAGERVFVGRTRELERVSASIASVRSQAKR
jgi:hypothetical protein